MKHANLLVLTLLLLAIGCVQDSLIGIEADGEASLAASESVAKKEVKMVPLKGYFDGYGWFNLSRTDCPAGSLPLDAEGVGSASHLGEFEAFFEYCSYAQVDPSNPTYVGRGVLTADNGDELHVTLGGTATSPITMVEDDIIVGGTGRFATASGAFSLVGSFGPHPAGFGLEWTFNGQMSSVGSSK